MDRAPENDFFSSPIHVLPKSTSKMKEEEREDLKDLANLDSEVMQFIRGKECQDSPGLHEHPHGFTSNSDYQGD